MRHAALLLTLLAACGANCPSIHSLYCDDDQKGLTCEFEEESGRPAACTCDGGTWTCNDCPNFARPIGACSASQSCSVWGFENACACDCDASGQWICTIDDPDPRFHCSP